MNPIDRKAMKNNLLYAIFPYSPTQEDIRTINKLIKSEINNINHYYFTMKDGSKRKLSFQITRILADLPARSKLSYFKPKGSYFCHLCVTSGIKNPIKKQSNTLFPFHKNTSIRDKKHIIEVEKKLCEGSYESFYGIKVRLKILI